MLDCLFSPLLSLFSSLSMGPNVSGPRMISGPQKAFKTDIYPLFKSHVRALFKWSHVWPSRVTCDPLRVTCDSLTGSHVIPVRERPYKRGLTLNRCILFLSLLLVFILLLPLRRRPRLEHPCYSLITNFSRAFPSFQTIIGEKQLRPDLLTFTSSFLRSISALWSLIICLPISLFCIPVSFSMNRHTLKWIQSVIRGSACTVSLR